MSTCRLHPLTVWQRSCYWQDINRLNLHAQRNQKHLKMGNDCYHSVKNLLSTCLLSPDNKIKIYRTTICLLFYEGVTPVSLILREENRLRVLRRELRKIFGVKGRSNRRLMKNALCLHDWYCSWAIKRMVDRACGTVRDGTGAHRVWWGNWLEKDHMEDLGVGWRKILKWTLKKWDGGRYVLNWSGWGQWQGARCCEQGNENSSSVRCREFFT